MSKEKKIKKNVEEPRAEDENKIIEDGLEIIYGNDNVDFSKLSKKKNRFTRILSSLIVFLFTVAITSWSGFYIYTNYIQVEQVDEFSINIESQESIVSGEKTKFVINYNNDTNVALAQLKIDVKIPSTFQILTITPAQTSADELSWIIGSLPAYSDGKIIIEGVWVADIGSKMPIQAFATYRPSNFNSDFSAITTNYISTSNSLLSVEISGSKEGVPGDKMDYKILVKNDSENDLENIKVNLSLPEGFYLEDSTPKIDSGTSTIWEIDKILGNSEEEIIFSGNFTADSEGFKYFNVDAVIQNGQIAMKQSESQVFTDILKNNISLQLVVNGSTEDVAVGMGEILRMSLAFENTGDSDIEEIELLMDFSSEKKMPILWKEAELDGGVTTKDGIKWDIENLGILTAGEKRVLNLSFPLYDSVGKNEADIFSILAQSTINKLSVKSAPVKISVISEANFTTEVRYFTVEGAPLGTGPLPPQVGKPTVYRVYWKIDNSLHDLDDMSVEAILPPNVEWVDQFDADLGNMRFDDASRTIKWSVVKIPNDIQKIEATFAVKVIPESSDVGTFIKLISGSTFKTTDNMAEKIITKTTESVSTELLDDEFASGKGVVVE